MTHYLNIGNCIFKNLLLLIRIKVINKSIKNLKPGKKYKEKITKLKHRELTDRDVYKCKKNIYEIFISYMFFIILTNYKDLA